MFQKSLLLPSSIALVMEAVSSSETLINIYQTTWKNITEDSHPLMTPTLFQMFQSIWLG
jgi:hypothetical protein